MHTKALSQHREEDIQNTNSHITPKGKRSKATSSLPEWDIVKYVRMQISDGINSSSIVHTRALSYGDLVYELRRIVEK